MNTILRFTYPRVVFGASQVTKLPGQTQPFLYGINLDALHANYTWGEAT